MHFLLGGGIKTNNNCMGLIPINVYRPLLFQNWLMSIPLMDQLKNSGYEQCSFLMKIKFDRTLPKLEKKYIFLDSHVYCKTRQ